MPVNTRPIPDIISDAVSQFTLLLRKEGQLARTEVSENINRAVAGVGLIATGAVLVIPALVILLQALVSMLAERGFDPHLAAAAVGGVVLVLGLILLTIGINRIKAENMVPRKTLNQLQQDASVAKEQARYRDDLQRAA